jgi:hypothetical protein
MDLWSPPHDAPHLLEWWRPLILVSRRARADRFPWPLHLDEFRLAGRVERHGRPDVWIYDHHESRGSVCVDARGQTYKFVATPNGKGVGQFRECPLRTALWRAGLPDVVDPIWYEPPRSPAGDGGEHDVHAEAEGQARKTDGPDGAAGAGEGEEPHVIRRGHLTLIAG